MQQTIYNNISIRSNIDVQTSQPEKTGTSARVLRWASHKWDLVGVLTLMGSSAAYGVFALTHLGL